MNKKILALIIALIAVIGTYGLVYAAVTTVLMPMDSESLKNELDTLETPVNNESSIGELESAAETMESIPLTYTSQSERTQMANSMRINNAFPPGLSNQDLDSYNNYNSFKIFLYNLMLRGDISNQMNNITATHMEIIRLNNETSSITQKMATDLEKGDSKAYSADLRNLANNVKQYDNSTAKLKIQLKTAIQLLGG